MRFSGTLLVLIILAIAVIFGAATWWRYSTDNPTSTDATLSWSDGQWVVEARFADEIELDFGPGTGAIVTSASFPERRMTGQVGTVRDDDSITVVLDYGPPDDAPKTTVPAEVTIDAATSPQ